MRTAAVLGEELAELVDRYAPECRTGPQAAADVDAFARIERLAAAGRMLAAGRVARTKAWEGSGHRSPADWLAARSGSSVNEAAGVLATSKQVQDLPATANAVRAGRLSPGQARAVADAAAADPASERTLLDAAASETFKGLTDQARRVKAAATDHAARDRLIHGRRSLRSFVDSDGAFNLHLRGTALAGTRITELLRPLEEQAFRTARTNGRRDSFEARSFDAFMDLVERLRQVGLDGEGTGAPDKGEDASDVDPGRAGGGDDGGRRGAAGVADEPGPVAGPGNGRRRVPRGANTKVIVRIDHTALLRGHTVPGETCEVAGLGPVSVATVQELMGDAFVAAVVTKGRDVVNVAHLGRTVSPHQRTALEAGGLACTNIACNQTVGIEIDHREPWAEVRETALANQDPLCRTDHLRKTHHGWSLEPGTGRRRFLPPEALVGTPTGTHGGGEQAGPDP